MLPCSIEDIHTNSYSGRTRTAQQNYISESTAGALTVLSISKYN